MEIFKLFGSILVDNDKANKSISDTDKKGKGLSGTLGKMGKAAGVMGAAMAAGAAIAGGGLLALVNKTAEAADYIDKLSERTGINREELQRWKYAADQSGADIGKLQVGVKTLSDVMADAIDGNEKATEAFTDLGISIDDLKNKSQSEIFDEVMKGLADMEEGAVRNALGNDLLGKSYTEMLPLLNAGSQGMSDLKTRADALGLVLSEEAVKANVVFGDTMADVKDSLGAVGMQIGTAVLPVFQSLLDWILSYMPQIQAFFQTTFEVINNVIMSVVGFIQNSLLPIFNSLWSDVSGNAPSIQEIFKTAFTIIRDVAETVYNFFKENILPIFTSWYEWISGYMPQIRDTFSVVFEKIFEVAGMVWGFFKNNILPILATLFGIVADKMPAIQAIFSTVFGIIFEVVKIVWDLFENFLLPILKGLWEFIEPIFPLIGDIVKTAFDVVIAIVEGVIDVFKRVVDAIKKAVDWLMFWKDEPDPEPKTVTVNTVYTSSSDGGGDVPKYARGTDFHPGGLAYVHEDELIELPRGSRVKTTSETNEILSRGRNITQNITINSPSPLSPSEVAKKNLQVSRRLAMEWL